MAIALCLSLGHNASAILVRDGKIIAGYEEERLSGIKSDSHFPELAIDRLLTDCPVPKDDLHICISHWFVNGKLNESDTKHLTMPLLRYISYERNWHYVDEVFTHHDAHKVAAQVFAGDFAKSATVLVMDGFGTFGETISIYDQDKLTFRAFGFDKSMGLLYQYATAYLGFKENQDEYKLLGYEAAYYPSSKMKDMVDLYSDVYANEILGQVIKKNQDPLFNMSALPITRSNVYDMLDTVTTYAELECDRIHGIAYFTQAVLENVTSWVVKNFSHGKIILSGGVFMNVKLNKVISDVSTDICIYPLCGDQGAALGVYQHVFGDLVWPEHVFWGHRDFDTLHGIKGIDYVSEADAPAIIKKALADDGMIQVIRGSMEFGARSLCHTCTLAVPTLENVKKINSANGRDTIMPMAPVMTEEQAISLFETGCNIVKSHEYMITALAARDTAVEDNFRGALNHYPRINEFTGRPQVTYDPFMIEILNETGPLINTSLNAHGQPIIFERDSIEKCMKLQNYSIRTLVIL